METKGKQKEKTKPFSEKVCGE